MKKKKLDQKLDVDQNQKTKYSAKLHTKIALITLMVGWFPMMFICAWGIHLEPIPRMAIFLSSFIICGGASMTMLHVIGNPVFWKSFKEVENLREDYILFKAKYQKALAEFVNNQKINTDE